MHTHTNSPIRKPPRPRHNLILRLPPIKPARHTTMLPLPLVTSPRGLALAGTRTPTAPDHLLVGILEVVEGAEEGGCGPGGVCREGAFGY